MSRRSSTHIGTEEGAPSTMSNALTEDYLRWLEPQIRETQSDRSKTYWDLLSIMLEKDFHMLVPHDENRMGDGLEVRREFYSQVGGDPYDDFYESPCSFLEVLIGLSRRLSFTAGGSAAGWAWALITNLELHKMSDPLGSRRAHKVEDILNRCIWRTYQPNGLGGFFPLGWPDEDQTQVEIWYQMAAYIGEMNTEHE